MNQIKKIGIIIVSILLLTSRITSTTYAREIANNNNDEDFYIETIITSDTPVNEIGILCFPNKSYPSKHIMINNVANSITKTKTSYFRSKDGTLLWSVSIKATFTYNGKTSKCTSCSHSANAPAKSWKIKSTSSTKKGNTASATAVATHTSIAGSRDYTRSITIKCSKKGVVS